MSYVGMPHQIWHCTTEHGINFEAVSDSMGCVAPCAQVRRNVDNNDGQGRRDQVANANLICRVNQLQVWCLFVGQTCTKLQCDMASKQDVFESSAQVCGQQYRRCAASEGVNARCRV